MKTPPSEPYIFGTHLPVRTETDIPDFETAWREAKERAREISPHAMMLSWYNGRTGEFHPRFECGRDERPAWIYSAEAKGADLTVDFNEGEFVFLFLK